MFRNPLTDLIIVVVVALIIFGPKRLPMLGRSLGQGLREFKEGIIGDGKQTEADERPALAPAASEPLASPNSAAAPPEPATASPASSPAAEPQSAEAVAPDRRP